MFLTIKMEKWLLLCAMTLLVLLCYRSRKELFQVVHTIDTQPIQSLRYQYYDSHFPDITYLKHVNKQWETPEYPEYSTPYWYRTNNTIVARKPQTRWMV